MLTRNCTPFISPRTATIARLPGPRFPGQHGECGLSSAPKAKWSRCDRSQSAELVSARPCCGDKRSANVDLWFELRVRLTPSEIRENDFGCCQPVSGQRAGRSRQLLFRLASKGGVTFHPKRRAAAQPAASARSRAKIRTAAAPCLPETVPGRPCRRRSGRETPPPACRRGPCAGRAPRPTRVPHSAAQCPRARE